MDLADKGLANRETRRKGIFLDRDLGEGIYCIHAAGNTRTDLQREFVSHPNSDIVATAAGGKSTSVWRDSIEAGMGFVTIIGYNFKNVGFQAFGTPVTGH